MPITLKATLRDGTIVVLGVLDHFTLGEPRFGKIATIGELRTADFQPADSQVVTLHGFEPASKA